MTKTGVVTRVLSAFALTVGATGIIGFAGVAPACACSCVQRSPTELAAGADAVFTGTVRTVRGPGLFAGPEDRAVATIDVDAVHKGDVAERVDVAAVPAEASCGVEFQAGERYIVYATTESAVAPYHTGFCTGTERLTAETGVGGVAAGPVTSPRAGAELASRAESRWALGAGLLVAAMLVGLPAALALRARRPSARHAVQGAGSG